MSTRTGDRPSQTVSSGTWWHSAAFAPTQTIVSNASPSPRSNIIDLTMHAIWRSVIPGRNFALASFHIATLRSLAARIFAISSAPFTARLRSMSRVMSTNFARGSIFCSFSKSATDIPFSNPMRRPAAPLPPHSRFTSGAKRLMSRTLSEGATRCAIGM